MTTLNMHDFLSSLRRNGLQLSLLVFLWGMASSTSGEEEGAEKRPADMKPEVSLTRVVLTENPAAGKPVSELYYEGSYVFQEDKPLKIPFHAEDSAQVANVEVRLYKDPQGDISEYVDTAPLGLKVVNNQGKKLVYLTIQPRAIQKETLQVTVKVPDFTPSSAFFKSTFVAYLTNESLSNRLLRRFTISNKYNYDWKNSKNKFILLLKSGGSVVYKNHEFSLLPAQSQRTFEEIIAAELEMNAAYVDLGKILDANGEPQPANLTGLPKYLFLSNGTVEACVRIPIPANDLQLKWHPEHSFPNQVDSIPLPISLPLSPASDLVQKCQCLLPAGKAAHRTHLDLGSDPKLTLPQAKRSAVTFWLPLTKTPDEIVYLKAAPWEMQLRNAQPQVRAVHFFDSRENYAAFSLPLELCANTTQEIKTDVWSVALKLERINQKESPAEYASAILALQNNLNHLRMTPKVAESLLPFYCLSPAARAAIEKEGIDSYLENLSNALSDSVPTAASYRIKTDELTSIRRELSALERLENQLADPTGDNTHWRELLRINKCREELTRKARMIEPELQRLLAQLSHGQNSSCEPKIFANAMPAAATTLYDAPLSKQASLLQPEILPSTMPLENVNLEELQPPGK